MPAPTVGSSLPQALCHAGLHMFPFHAQQSLYRETQRLGEVRQSLAHSRQGWVPTPNTRSLAQERVASHEGRAWVSRKGVGLQAAEATQGERAPDFQGTR